jgi:hypothetical protein
MRSTTPHPFRGAPSIIAALLFTAAAACSGGDQDADIDDSSAAPSERATVLDDLDACALLTDDEILAATGHEPGPGTDPGADIRDAVPACEWPSADGSVGQVAQVLVGPTTADSFEEHRDAMMADGLEGLREIEGVGRFASFLESVNMLYAFGETHMVTVTVEPAPGHDAVAAATALARAVLERVE